jgi:hypothetical protein
MEYTVEITTVPGIADSDYLDRLAEIVYETKILIDPLLGLEDNGSVTASFCFVGANPAIAASEAVNAFVLAVAAAQPLRGPTPNESGKGSREAAMALSRFAAATVGSFGLARVEEREKVLA